MENLILVGHIVFGFASFVGSLLLTIGVGTFLVFHQAF